MTFSAFCAPKTLELLKVASGCGLPAVAAKVALATYPPQDIVRLAIFWRWLPLEMLERTLHKRHYSFPGKNDARNRSEHILRFGNRFAACRVWNLKFGLYAIPKDKHDKTIVGIVRQPDHRREKPRHV